MTTTFQSGPPRLTFQRLHPTMYHHVSDSSGAGAILRVLPKPPGATSNVGTSLTGLWKRQIAEKACASCPHPDCRMSYLSLAGILAHFRTCCGKADPHDYTTCGLCGCRFKTFKSLRTHQEKVRTSMDFFN